jgi:hypothetical protein
MTKSVFGSGRVAFGNGDGSFTSAAPSFPSVHFHIFALCCRFNSPEIRSAYSLGSLQAQSTYTLVVQ